MRDWEMAEHFAERDGVRMSSGQHIQAPESMIDRARRIVAQPWNYPTVVEWAKALLAEHAARQQAERERDASRQFSDKAGAEWRRNQERAEAAEARVADLEAALAEAEPYVNTWGSVTRFSGTTDAIVAVTEKRNAVADRIRRVLAGGSDEQS